MDLGSVDRITADAIGEPGPARRREGERIARMDLGPVDRITADAIGEPGMRTFYLQVRAGEQLVTVIVEKEQVELLARSVLELATEVPIPDDVKSEELS